METLLEVTGEIFFPTNFYLQGSDPVLILYTKDVVFLIMLKKYNPKVDKWDKVFMNQKNKKLRKKT